MKNKKADLHIHTTFSDSTLSPQEVVRKAKEAGLSCIAICDHDAVGGIEPALQESSTLGIEIIPGVELTAEINETEIHILGYLINWKFDWFESKLLKLREARRKRFVQMIEKLEEFDIYLKDKIIFKDKQHTSMGRLHLARELLKYGYVNSVKEAFYLYLGKGKPCYVKKEMLIPGEAIDMIKKLGGIAVLAHPYLMGDDNLIPQLVKVGLDGIEVYHPEQSPSSEKRYKSIAENYNLLITGGSDCHGLGKGKILIGTIKIDYSLVERMKEYKNAFQKR